MAVASASDLLEANSPPAGTPVNAVARGALALLTAQPLTWATSMLAIVLVPRYLGDAAYGEATLGSTLVTVVGPAATLGILDYLTRSLPSKPKAGLTEAAQAWFVMTGTAILAAALMVLGVAWSGLTLGNPLVLVASVGMIIALPTQGLLLTILRGRERMGQYALVNSISGAATALVPILVLVAGGGLGGFAITTFLVTLVAIGVSWWKSGIRLPRVQISPRIALALIGAGLPFFGWTLTVQFYGQVDRLLLGFMAPVQVVGWYSAAFRIIGIPIFVPMLIVTPLLPALTRCRADAAVFRRTLNTSLRVTLLVTLPFCAATAAAAPAIPGFLGWPGDFDGAVLPMTVLAPNLTLVALDMMLGTALIALGFERKWFVVGLIACFVSPSLNLLAIPYAQSTWGNGSVGAAAVTIVTETVTLVGALILMPRGVLDFSIVSLGGRILLAAAPFVAITRQLVTMDVYLPLALIPGGLLFLGLALGLRVVSVSEVRAAYGMAVHVVGAKFARSR